MQHEIEVNLTSDTASADHAKTSGDIMAFVNRHGRDRVAAAAFGGLAVLGTVAPFTHVNGLFDSSYSMNVLQIGFWGFVLLLISAALGASPFVFPATKNLSLVQYGLSTAFFGLFLIMWILGSSLSSAIGGGGGLSVGFYLLLVGYAGLTVLNFRESRRL